MLDRILQKLRGSPAKSMPEAIAHHEAGRFAEAEAIYRRVLEAEPGHVDALHFLGFLSFQRGEHQRAAELIARSLEQHPENLFALYNLGRVRQAQGDTAQAAAHYREAIRLNPGHYESQYKLAGLLLAGGDADGAAAGYQRVIELEPEFAPAWSDLGNAQRAQRLFAEAIASYQQALRLNPQLVEARYNLGIAYRDTQRRDEAVACFEQLVAERPEFAEAHYCLGHMRRDADRVADAGRSFRRALELRPDYSEARWSLAMAQIPQVYETAGESAAARSAFSDALGDLERWLVEHPPADASVTVGVMQPFSLAYQEENNRDLLARYGRLCSDQMARWASREGLAAPAAARRPGPLRVGIVSGHFRNHSVWHAIVKGWFQHLDRERFALQAFYLFNEEDAETALARARAVRFERGLRSVRQWVETLRDAAPDVLIYPEIGMDPVSIKLASLRLAPVQAVAWGHPETSGLPTMDYFLSAEDMEPPGAQAHYAEKLVALPHCGGHVELRDAKVQEPDLAAAGIEADCPLLVCPGVPFKYTPQHDQVFPEIAARLGRCRMVFFAYGTPGLSQKFQTRLRGVFTARGLDFDRFVTFLPWQTNAAFHGWMTRADVYLDTIGFSGFNTAAQAIQRALPVVTQDGRFLRGRLASGPLRRIGMPELITASDEEYVALAVRLVQDGDFSEHIEKRLHENGNTLFSDLASVRGLEAFLERAKPA